VVNKLNEICSGRGRKGTDRFEQIELIKELRSISKQNNLGAAMDVKILFNQIAISFDYNSRVTNCMKTEVWNECLKFLEEIIAILMENDTIEFNDHINDDEENLGADKTKPFKIRGCVLTMTDRMYEEFIKILQQCDAHGSEYVERLKDEPKICQLIDQLQVEINEHFTRNESIIFFYYK
jgi:translation initiation factor 3 subunit C